jgi:hypothetical protein
VTSFDMSAILEETPGDVLLRCFYRLVLQAGFTGLFYSLFIQACSVVLFYDGLQLFYRLV